MPNWCSCYLEVTGPTEDMERFLKIAIRHGDFLLNNVVPRPEALEGLCYGGCTIDGDHVKVWREKEGPDGKMVPEKVDVDALIRAYGYADWYNWSIANWGTKWDVEAKVEVVDTDGKKYLKAHFDTAWSPPSQFLHTMAEKWPTLEGLLAYAECGQGYWGVDYIEEGDVTEHHSSGAFFKEPPEELSEEERDSWWDQDREEILRRPVLEHLERYGLHTGG